MATNLWEDTSLLFGLMLITACATGVGVDMYISDMALNPPYYNRMLKWFNFNCKWCWEVQYNEFIFTMSRLRAHLSQTCCCIWCCCVLTTVRPLNWRCCIRANFHGDAPLWVTTRGSSKQEKNKFQVFTRTFSYFAIAWQGLDSFVRLPWLSFSQSPSQVLILNSPPFFLNIQKCVPGPHCRISSALLPYGSISQSSVSFTCSFLLIWLSGYTKHIQNQYVQYSNTLLIPPLIM